MVETEPIDAAELAALERAADATNGERPVKTGDALEQILAHERSTSGPTAESPPPSAAPITAPAARPSGVDTPGLTPVWKVGEDGKLVPLVEAAAIEARLDAQDAMLREIHAQVRHTMLLTMLLTDRFNVTAKEYDAAERMAVQAAQRAQGETKP